MKITWYGHSCFAVEHKGYTVLLDPYYTGAVPGLVFPVPAVNEVLCSHTHRDHGNAEGVKPVPGENPFVLTKVTAFHDHHNGEHRGQDTIHILEADGLRVAHLGDLGHVLAAEQVEQIGRLDAVMIPVGGHYTINPAEAKQVVEQLRPRVVIPMHYRGEGFGYPVIGTLEAFTELCGDVRMHSTNSIEITAETEAQTAVLSIPAEVLADAEEE